VNYELSSDENDVYFAVLSPNRDQRRRIKHYRRLF